MNFHENLNRSEKLKLGSDRKFGFTFTAIFVFASLHFFRHSSFLFGISILSVSILTCLVTMFKPVWLHSFNLSWMKFAKLLNAFISPIILFILFYAVFVPTGLILKICNKDILNLKKKSTSSTYWIKSSSDLFSMKDQF